MFIRKATVTDKEVLSHIGGITIIESHGHSAAPEIMQAYVDDKFSLDSINKELKDPDNIFHLIYQDEKPAGYSKIIYNIPHENVPHSNVTKMERLYLLQEFHSLKLGHKLMEFNITLAKEQNQQGIWLQVWKGNDRALNFYKRAGFEIVGEGDFRLTATHVNPNWIMYLELRY